MSYFNCPYCNAPQEEDSEATDESETYQQQCSQCEKNFVFTISWSKDYSESKADCLNGGEHNYRDIIGFPKEYFKGRRRCSMCSKEIKEVLK